MSNITSSQFSKILFVLCFLFLFATISTTYFGEGAYVWIKALHTIAVIAWMAGMLYLPRIFVYHCEARIGSDISETFKVMERKLLLIIMNPAMVATWILGIWMAWQQSWYYSGWFMSKLALVSLMSVVHVCLCVSVRTFANDKNTNSAYYWRVFNEIPTVLLIGIVLLVVAKPF